ncbi:hypothetical protein N7452_001531 [Penicillium brevicompactum]|uniref:Uncharacterized protein n=1 Tax=Penicillium brevicompactum TaxID=5074 RepID=A0A9W9UPL6_PENBR|nr:hypothetical protein N7452_001531 [Penicillium brevicompactum]
MGRASKQLVSFIEGIPEQKLLDLAIGLGKYSTENYFTRVTQTSAAQNGHQVISILGSSSTNISTAADLANEVVTQAKVPTDGSWTAEMIRKELIANRLI